MTSKYRKKPVEIEAMKMPEAGEQDVAMKAMEVYRWIEDNTEGSFDPMGETPATGVTIDPGTGLIQIATLEGRMNVALGDWVIRGVQGEFYPCKPDIFAATYEPANADWVLVREGIAVDGEPPIWGYVDDPHLFSLDMGETFYDTTEPLNNDGTPTIYTKEQLNG